jgi:hemoglobin-like flavoprotein
MNSYQIASVRASWKSVAPRAEMIVNTFFSRLYDNDPRTAALLSRVDAHDHRAKFVLMFDKLIAALDDPEALVGLAASLGRRHASYSVEERHFDAFRESFIETLEATLGPPFTPELRAAWTEAWALVASLMARAIWRETTMHS